MDEKLIRDDEDELENDDESRLNSLHPSLYDSWLVAQFKRNNNIICDRISENGSKSHMKSIVIQHVFNYISTYAYVFPGYLLYIFNNLSIKFHVML